MKRIVAIGASSVQGSVDIEGGWAGRFQKHLFKKSPTEHRIFNLGISGTTSEMVLKRFDSECDVRRPDTIIVSCGGNDAIRRGAVNADRMIALNQTVLNLKNILEKAKNKANKVVFVGFTPVIDEKLKPFRGDIFFLNSDVEENNNAVKTLCEEMGVSFVDTYTAMIEEDDWQKYIWDDGLHPNSAGHQRILEILLETLGID